MSNDKRQILNNAHKLLDRGLYDRAIREYMRIVELDPSDVFALQKMQIKEACVCEAPASALWFWSFFLKL